MHQERERERTSLVTHLETQTLTENQLLGFQELAATVVKELNGMDDDYVTRRQVIEALDVQVTLAVDDGQKVAYTRLSWSNFLIRSLSGQSPKGDIDSEWLTVEWMYYSASTGRKPRAEVES